jgi:electron transport complex protein RnfG
MNIVRNMIISAVLLALFAIAGTFFVSFTFENTIDRINENNRIALLKAFHVLISPQEHDNDIFSDFISVKNKALLGNDKPVNVYRARKQNKPVAVIINSVAPDGYNGKIELLVAIYYDGTLAGVRVVQHKETPGLGDAIDEQRSDWILKFNQRSLTSPAKKGWAVKRDGGDFDQFTGATITPRAIVKAVYNTLTYYKQHRDNQETLMP